MAGSSQLVQIELGGPLRMPKPSWLRARAPVGDNFHNLKTLARGLGLHTVCESAQCPNIGECWSHKTATFMLLGDICTRRCGFCAVPKGKPQPIDGDEPRRVADLIRDRQLLEAAKREAAAVIGGPNAEISEVEISRALLYMRSRWQHSYGLVEVG